MLCAIWVRIDSGRIDRKQGSVALIQRKPLYVRLNFRDGHEAKIQPNAMAYDLGGEAMTSVMRAGMRISGLCRRNSLITPSAVNMIIPPAEQILRHAEDNHADMIVMGRRGMTPATRWILGSVSERVMRYAHCPVTVVK